MFSGGKRHVDVWIVLSFIAMSWLSVFLLMSIHSLLGASDLPMHLHQLREVQLALQHHNLVYYGLNEFHGSAIMTLYPWLNLWPAAVLSTLIKSHFTAIYLYFMFNELSVLIISYFSSLHFDRSKRISYLFSIFYGLSTLYLDYGFADMDWGELLTMTFLPLVIFGAIALFQNGEWLELSAGMTLIISSHVLNTLIVTSLLVIFVIINIFKFRSRVFINLLKAIALTVLTTIVIWLPAFKLIYLNRNLTTPTKFPLYGQPFKNILISAFDGRISYGISVVAVLGLALGALYFFRLNRYIEQLYLISVIIVAMCCTWFPWHLIPQPLSMIQFTWRLYIIPELCLSYVSAEVLVDIVARNRFANVALIIGAIFVSIGFQLESQQQLVCLTGNAPVVNKRFLKGKERPYARDGNVVYIKTKNSYHPHANIMTPKYYRIVNNDSYDSLLNQKWFLQTDNSYWPQIVKSHYNDINDNYIRSKQGLDSRLYSNGYDHFTFTNKHVQTGAFLPILHYNGEAMKITLDGHEVHDNSRQNLLYVKRLPKGTHEMSIHIKKDRVYRLSCVALLIGILSYIGLTWCRIVKYDKKISDHEF